MVFTILIDDREKQPYSFPQFDTEQARLDVGDYAIEGYENYFAVERKSLNDLASSCGSSRDRFEAEIQRAQDLASFVVVIESDKTDAKGGNYFSKMHPNALIGTIDAWEPRYDTLRFEWCKSREGARDRTVELLTEWDRRFLHPAHY